MPKLDEQSWRDQIEAAVMLFYGKGSVVIQQSDNTVTATSSAPGSFDLLEFISTLPACTRTRLYNVPNKSSRDVGFKFIFSPSEDIEDDEDLIEAAERCPAPEQQKHANVVSVQAPQRHSIAIDLLIYTACAILLSCVAMFIVNSNAVKKFF